MMQISVVPAGYPLRVRVPGNPRVRKFGPVTLPVPAGTGSKNDGYGYGYTRKYPWVQTVKFGVYDSFKPCSDISVLHGPQIVKFGVYD